MASNNFSHVSERYSVDCVSSAAFTCNSLAIIIEAKEVTNIVNDFNKGLADSEFESIRELEVESRKQGLILSDLGSSLGLYNYIKKFGTNQGQIESLILNLANYPEPEDLVDVAFQATPLSKTESIALERIANHIKQKQEEKRILEEEIKQAFLLSLCIV